MLEILNIAAYRTIKKNGDIPELKFRRDPITETTLMEFWGDEARRATVYLQKYAPTKVSARKAEHENWQAFFRHKYGDPILPNFFWELDRDLRE